MADSINTDRESLLLGLALSWLDLDIRFHDTTIGAPGNELWSGFVSTAAQILRTFDLTCVDAVFGALIEHLEIQRDFEGDMGAWLDTHGWPQRSWELWQKRIREDIAHDMTVLLRVAA